MSQLSFEYVALDRAGVRRQGVMSAAGRDEAYRKVAATGLTPVKLKQVRQRGVKIAVGSRVTAQDIAQFTYQLSALLTARIPVADGIRGAAEQESNPRLRKALFQIAADIQSGSTIADALDRQKSLFGSVYVETIRAAEKSGSLIKALGYLAEMTERRQEARQAIRQALTYPVIVLTALGTATLFLLVFVVPRFAAMFEERGVELPALTRGLQAAGESMRQFWWAYGLAVAGVGFGLWALRRSERGRAGIDTALHRTPLLRRVLVGLAVARFTRVFAVCLEAGLGLIESLEMSGRSSGRPLLQREVKLMSEQVRQGERLSGAFTSRSYIPSFARRLISAGEESAELSRMCNLVARHYERESMHLIKNASTVLEPLLIALLTGVVLVIALAIFLPMWDMVRLVG
ncbi:MAG: type II secretion system F family protein [Planctomycetota bacterium]|nr:type II secretion system F family protein [Planctomycetota bacterium]